MSALPWKCDKCQASFFKVNLLKMHQASFHQEAVQPIDKPTRKIIVPPNDPPRRVFEKISAITTPPKQHSDDSDEYDSERARLEQKFNHLNVIQRVHKLAEFAKDISLNDPGHTRQVKLEFEDDRMEEVNLPDLELNNKEGTEEIMSPEVGKEDAEDDEIYFLVVKEDGMYVSEVVNEDSVDNTADNTYEVITLDQSSKAYHEDEESDTAISYRPDNVTTVPYKPMRVMARPVPNEIELKKLKAMRSQGLQVKRLGLLEFKCKRCELVFPTRHERRLHLETHARDLRYFCSECGRGFRKTHSLKLHLNVHTEGSHHQCPYCHQFYRAQRYLKEHIKLHIPEEYKYKCDICDKKFAHRVSWRYHKRSHTNEAPFMCNLCGKAYRQRVSLEAHLNLHQGTRPHKCEECGKGFRTATTLRDHRRLHTNERPFICRHPGCDKKYILKNQLKNHMKKHTGERNFACSVNGCAKRFFFRSHLVRHLTRTHKLQKLNTLEGDAYGVIDGSDGTESEF